MFSRYRIYHFEDFTCVPPVSIDSGKTHQKSPAHSLVFRRFFEKCVWPIFQTGIAITSNHPHSVHYNNMFCRFTVCSSGPLSQTQKGVRGGLEYDVPPSVKNPRKIYKKDTKNCHWLSMYTTGTEKKSYMCPPGIEFLTPVATSSSQHTPIVV